LVVRNTKSDINCRMLMDRILKENCFETKRFFWDRDFKDMALPACLSKFRKNLCEGDSLDLSITSSFLISRTVPETFTPFWPE